MQMCTQQFQRLRVMGFDCIDGELHTFGYFRVGKFVAHFHQADFTLLGRLRVADGANGLQEYKVPLYERILKK